MNPKVSQQLKTRRLIQPEQTQQRQHRIQKPVTQPARRKVQVLPGQSLLSQYFKVTQKLDMPSKPQNIQDIHSNPPGIQNILSSMQPTEKPSLSQVHQSISNLEGNTQENKPSLSQAHQSASNLEGNPQENKHQPIMKPSLQRTLYDFEFFKPHALISESDPDIWGHASESINSTSTLRIILQNPNGIRPSVTNTDFMFSLHLCSEIGAEAICLAETNLNWHHSQHHASLRRCLHKNWSASKYQTSVLKENFLGDYQPGGTVTLAVDRWTSRVISSGADPYGLGRWSYLKLRGKQERQICIITAYRVCKNKYTGPKTAYQQQRRQLSEMFRQQNEVIDPEPNRQFILDLQSWITHIQADGTQIILGLDNNDELIPSSGQVTPLQYIPNVPTVQAQHNGTLGTLLRSTGLVDILSHHHPSPQYPATYNRGRKRIDLLLVSASLLPAVVRSGILPYHSLFQGDHRPCYIDLESSIAFDGKPPSISPPRVLQTKDPRIVAKYIKKLTDQLEKHKVLPKLQELYLLESHQWTDQTQQTYERLDKIITEAMLYAEEASAKKYINKYEWSPTLVCSVYAERFWRLALRKSQGRHISQNLFERTRLSAGIQVDPSTLAMPDVIQCLACARQTRKELQQQHQSLRKNYLEKLAEALVLKRAPYLDTNPKYEERLTQRTAKEVKRLIRLEQKRKLYRMIGTRLGDLNENARGLTRVDVPLHSPNIPLSSIPDPKTWKGPWRSVTDPEEIAQYICVTNTRQYNQAQHTPFGSGYLANTIGLNIEKPAAIQILNGNFSVDPSVKLLPETHRIIEYLNSLTQYNTPFPSTITVQEFQATYRLVKEKTSSSASGRHVGHYKAAAQNDALSQIHSMMMSLPYKIGFSPTRWRKIVDVMLEKDPGNPKLHRLRIIALIESDYNQSQRILIARRLTHRLEDNHLVPEMQYGSRPGKLCITPTLNKQLTHDIIRQSKQTVAIIENDAVGCYDRLMNPLLLLTMRKFGVTATMAKSAGLTWSLTSHTIKTQYGVSESSYTNDPSTPLFGPSQGSTTGPTLWQLSYILLTISAFAQGEINNNMEENDDDDPVPSLGFPSVDLADKLDNNGESFVDDSNLVSTSSIPQESHHVSTVDQLLQSKSAVENLQQLAQSWEKALFSTGGGNKFPKELLVLIPLAVEEWGGKTSLSSRYITVKVDRG